MKTTVLTIFSLGIIMFNYAQQFDASAEFKPRFEYRHGFKKLINDNEDAASFVSQRTRLNLNYVSEKLNAYIAVQNVRVWGDVSTLAISDKNGFAVHEAWAKAILSPEFSIKLGRQEIKYDNQRIFGSADWAQQGRSHDAFVATYQPSKTQRFDLGLALNANSESLVEQLYTVNNSKAFQYLWYHLNVNKIGLSFLALNNGLAYERNNKQEVDYNQTFGTYIKYGQKDFSADGSLYVQTGEIAETKVSALQVSGNINYGFTNGIKLGVGAEYLSGTDMGSNAGKIKSFTPWFGTNHKFNGWMDYFFVGNHFGSVGLVDIHGTFAYSKNKFSLAFKPHLFSAAAKVIDGNGNEKDNSLGTELDFTFGYKIAKDINLKVGYSQLFGTESLEVIRGGNRNNTNNWAWVMFVFKPKLFSYTHTN